MSDIYLNGIMPSLRGICAEIRRQCNDNNISYFIAENEYDHQVYVIEDCRSRTKIVELIREMACNGGIVVYEGDDGIIVCNNSLDNTNGLVDIREKLQEPTSEDQYKSPSRKMIRKQSMFRSSFGPSKSFGGISGYNGKKRKAVRECCQGMVGKLKQELLAHDNVTVIPSGANIKIVDAADSLPDVEYEGKIISVDKDKLVEAFEPNAFNEQLMLALENVEYIPDESHKSPELDDKLSGVLGGTIRIKNQDILVTLDDMDKA